MAGSEWGEGGSASNGWAGRAGVDADAGVMERCEEDLQLIGGEGADDCRRADDERGPEPGGGR